MRLITKVRIEGFRSLRSAEIKPLADFTAFAGPNNSGKSNVLRALNAFFNDETDASHRPDVDTDYFRSDLRKKKRKRIAVSVTFELPENFKFRKGLEGVESLFGDRYFTIAKEWTRTTAVPTILLNGRELNADGQQKVAQFLQLIKYRYVPNRVLPAEVIRNEHQSLRDVLVRRIAKSAKGNVKTFEAIRTTSERMVGPLARRFEQACPGQGKVSLVTPTSWSDLAFAFGYQLAQGEIQTRDTEQGSGIQSLLMLETLYLIDRDYFQQFGWRQAAIWGVEEPESSLHTSLEARVAAYLAKIAADPQNRLQLLCTTHSDLMVQYAGCTVVVDKQDGESKFEPIDDPYKAVRRLSETGIARLVRAFQLFPLDPFILVEGKFDREFLEQSLWFFKPKRRVQLVDLSVLDPTSDSGGLDRMRQYIKDNAKAIELRPKEAPVLVVLGWDAAKKEIEFKSLVKSSSAYKVLTWPESSSNPKLGPSFKGIERFYSERVIKLAIEQGADIAQLQQGKHKGQYIVEAQAYHKVKEKLAVIVRAGLQEGDFVHAKVFIMMLLEEAGAI